MSIFSKTKTFFKAKPIRIIIALCVIAAIMVAVGIGISALVKNLTNKCANQPGTDWNSEVGKCVTRGCQNICKTGGRKGSCDDDICTGSNEEGYPYVYDENLCECVLDCSTAGVHGNGKDQNGREYTSYYWDGSTSTPMDSHGKPIKKIYCGVKCDLASVNDPYSTGINNCPETSLCGINKFVGGQEPFKGRCLPGNYSTCPSPNIDDNACYEQDACTMSDDKQRCKIEYCSTDENQNMLALYDSKLSKCTDKDGKSEDPILLKNLGKNTRKDFSKFSQNLKYCPYKSTAIRGASKYCVTMTGLAETTKDNKSSIFYDCNNNKDEANREGISTYTPQCFHSIDTNTGCISKGYDLCPNLWQASPNTSKDEYCLPVGSKIEGGSPWENAGDLGKGYCCDTNTRHSNPDDPDNYYCCYSPIQPQDTYCLNKSSGPADISLFSGGQYPPYTPQTCVLPAGTKQLNEKTKDVGTHDQNIITYSKNLRDSVGANQDAKVGENDYVGVICESTYEDGKLSGPYYKVVAGTWNESPPEYSDKYAILQNGKSSKSIETYSVVHKNDCTAILTGKDTANNSTDSEYKIPLCTDESNNEWWHATGDEINELSIRQKLYFNKDGSACESASSNDFIKTLGQNLSNLNNIQYIPSDTGNHPHYNLYYGCGSSTVVLPLRSGLNTTKYKWSDINGSLNEVNWGLVFNQNQIPCVPTPYPYGACNAPFNFDRKSPATKNFGCTSQPCLADVDFMKNSHLSIDGKYCKKPGICTSGKCGSWDENYEDCTET